MYEWLFVKVRFQTAHIRWLPLGEKVLPLRERHVSAQLSPPVSLEDRAELRSELSFSPSRMCAMCATIVHSRETIYRRSATNHSKTLQNRLEMPHRISVCTYVRRKSVHLPGSEPLVPARFTALSCVKTSDLSLSWNGTPYILVYSPSVHS